MAARVRSSLGPDFFYSYFAFYQPVLISLQRNAISLKTAKFSFSVEGFFSFIFCARTI